MILIDTSVWIEFFRKGGMKNIKSKVAILIKTDQAAFTCPVFMELLSGARGTEEDFIIETFDVCLRIEFKPDWWGKAGRLEKKLRQNGLTIPRDDILIATVAIESHCLLYCRDKHFDLIRKTANQLLLENVRD
ncbi:MAG: PIN domain-containing protein [Verrucomicrobiota bacterium]|nr:PIN domain-containing protein [Verrucomicrobiota bacterium]